jgi:N,N'-diacetyllegionaminate synthase
MKIKDFDLSQKVLVVAEVGNNHEGNFENAKKMVNAAADCKVHAVKFQTFKTELFVSPADPQRFKKLKSFELNEDQFTELAKLAHARGLLFISTPLDLKSADFLNSMVDCFKIASGDNNFYPLIKDLARTGKPLIFSSGFSDLPQAEKMVKYVQQEWAALKIKQELALLHCVSGYPVPDDQADLKSIQSLEKRLSCTVGYSDHTLGIQACLASIALGARVIEKHFTLDKNFSDFRDHKISADPKEMSELVLGIERVEKMLGNGQKSIQPIASSIQILSQRSIVAGKNLSQGHSIQLSDLTWLRPAGGLEPGMEHLLIGKKLKRNLESGEKLQLSDLE